MGTKRVGLARTAALIENLKRSIDWNGSTFSDLTLTSPTITTPTTTRPTITEPALTARTYEINNSDSAQHINMTTTTSVPSSMIFIEAAGDSNVNDINITLPTKEGGLSYTFLCVGNAGSSVSVAFTGTSGSTTTAAYLFTKEGAPAAPVAFWETSGQTHFYWADGTFKQGTKLNAMCDGNNWYFEGLTTTSSGNLNSA